MKNCLICDKLMPTEPIAMHKDGFRGYRCECYFRVHYQNEVCTGIGFYIKEHYIFSSLETNLTNVRKEVFLGDQEMPSYWLEDVCSFPLAISFPPTKESVGLFIKRFPTLLAFS